MPLYKEQTNLVGNKGILELGYLTHVTHKIKAPTGHVGALAYSGGSCLEKDYVAVDQSLVSVGTGTEAEVNVHHSPENLPTYRNAIHGVPTKDNRLLYPHFIIVPLVR